MDICGRPEGWLQPGGQHPLSLSLSLCSPSAASKCFLQHSLKVTFQSDISKCVLLGIFLSFLFFVFVFCFKHPYSNEWKAVRVREM